MELINLTPHSINIMDTDGGMVSLPPSGSVARVATKPGIQIGSPANLKGIRFYSAPEWGEVEGLPAPQEGKLYIVSALVAGRCPNRADVYSPGTGPADEPVRENGQVKAVTRLVAALVE